MLDRLRLLLASRTKKEYYEPSRLRAAVLVPAFCKGNELHILFTKRSQEVMHHKGEISFPGGAFSREDGDLKETALRESWEEIGLKPQDVEIIGDLDTAETLTSNFVVKPYVGLIPYPYKFTTSRAEVDSIFLIPVTDLLNKDKCESGYWEKDGLDDIYSYRYKGEVIWGATALILNQLLNIIRDCRGVQQ